MDYSKSRITSDNLKVQSSINSNIYLKPTLESIHSLSPFKVRSYQPNESLNQRNNSIKEEFANQLKALTKSYEGRNRPKELYPYEHETNTKNYYKSKNESISTNKDIVIESYKNINFSMHSLQIGVKFLLIVLHEKSKGIKPVNLLVTTYSSF